jgi:hypothetical protein
MSIKIDYLWHYLDKPVLIYVDGSSEKVYQGIFRGLVLLSELSETPFNEIGLYNGKKTTIIGSGSRILYTDAKGKLMSFDLHFVKEVKRDTRKPK